MSLEGSGTAVVTGASSGIGAAYADALAARGYDLVLVARRRERLRETADRLRSTHDGSRVDVMVADLALDADIAHVASHVEHGPNVTMLVNSAGLGALGAAATIDPEAVDRAVKVNVLALTRLSLSAARRFAAAGSGTIINIGSVMAFKPVPTAGPYTGSKAYVLTFTRALDAELSSQGVTLQVVMPGPVRSEFFGDEPAPFPDHLFMSATTLVEVALQALDRGETVYLPTLHDPDAWRGFEDARGRLAQALLEHGIPPACSGAGPIAPSP